MKILFIDIECSPMVTLSWGRYKQNAFVVKAESELLSASWKFKGDAEVSGAHCSSNKTRKALLKKLAKLIDRADVVVGHNAEGFDVKRINTWCDKYGVKRLGHVRVVDTLREVKKHYYLSSRRLGDVCEYFGLGKKLDNGGGATFDAAMQGDKAALDLMLLYNKQDIVLSEALYDFMLPRIDSHPNVALAQGRPRGCNKCGSPRLRSHGWSYTKTKKIRRYNCLDCGGRVSGKAFDIKKGS